MSHRPGGTERANYQIFIGDLCELLDAFVVLGRTRQSSGGWTGA